MARAASDSLLSCWNASGTRGVLMKLYAAMVVGLAIGAGVALLLAARELEDAPSTTPTTPATLVERPTGA